MVPARRIGKTIHVGIHVVPLHVIRARDVPPSREVHQMGGGQIQFLLAVHIVYHHHRGVLVHILGQIVGILGHQTYMIAGGEVLLQTALQKGIVVPDALTPAPHVVDNGTGDSALGSVVVCFEHPLAPAESAQQRALHAGGPYVTVLPHSRRVIHYLVCHHCLAAVTELIRSIAAQPFTAERRRHPIGQLQFHEQGRVHQPKRTAPQCSLQVIVGAVREHGPARPHIDGTCSIEILGRLEYLALLAIVERDVLDVVEREHAQVHLTVLGV